MVGYEFVPWRKCLSIPPRMKKKSIFKNSSQKKKTTEPFNKTKNDMIFVHLFFGEGFVSRRC